MQSQESLFKRIKNYFGVDPQHSHAIGETLQDEQEGSDISFYSLETPTGIPFLTLEIDNKSWVIIGVRHHSVPGDMMRRLNS